MSRPTTFKPEMDALIREAIQQRKSSTEVAEEFGVHPKTVRRWSHQIGCRFERYAKHTRSQDRNHIAADERSAELLRKAGVRI